MIRAVGLAVLVAASAAAASSRPQPRIVSINPCVDAVLMQVADAGQIAAISHYSKDPRATSITMAQAARFAVTSGTAEEVVALAPDLVIAGAHVAPSTIAALKRMRIALLQLDVPDTIMQSRDQIQQIAVAAGHPARGRRLNRQIDAALAASLWDGPPVPALIWQGGGLVPGDDTLASELLHHTGFHNLSADYGLKKWDVLPLEYLVARPPRILFSVGDATGADRMLSHPVLRPLAGHISIRPYPERLLRCGGPTIIAAVAQLAWARQNVEARPRKPGQLL